MVQRHAHKALGIQAGQPEPEKPSYSLLHESRNRGGSAGLKRKMKKPSSKPSKNSDSRSQRSEVPQLGKPSPSAFQPGDVQTSLQHKRCHTRTGAPQASSLTQSSFKTSNGSSPNYMNPTSSSNSRKEMSQVSASTYTFGKKPGRTLTRTSSLKTVSRTLTKTPSFKTLRRTKPLSKKCPQVAFSAPSNVEQPTCSSTLKDSKFPAYILLAPGGTESEGTSVPNVCPYTYCSLNGHHCPIPPPLRCFVAAMRRSLKTQRKGKAGAPSTRPEEKPVFQEEDYCMDIYAAEMEEVQGTELPHSDMANANEGIEEGVAEGDRQVMAVCGCDTGSEATDMDWEEGQFYSQIDNNEVDDSVHRDDETYNKSGYSSEFEKSDSVFESFEYTQVEIFGYGECFEEEEDETDEKTNDFIGTVATSTEASVSTIDTLAMKPPLSSRANILVLPDEALEMDADQHENQTLTDSVFCDNETDLKNGCSFDISNSGEEPIFVSDNDTVCQNRNIDENNGTLFRSTEVLEPKIETHSIEPLLSNEALTETNKHENQTLLDEVWEAIVVKLPIKPLLFDGLIDEAPIDDAGHENETLHTDCPLLGKQISSDEKKTNEDESKEVVLEESLHANTQEMDLKYKDETSSSMGTAIFEAGRESNEELADTCNKLKLRKGCPRAESNGEAPRKFNPREPNFLPSEADPEAEKVDLRHQMMDERKNTEDWMLDHALQQTVNKLAPARNRKVALLVEAYETVLPIPNRETHQRHPPTAFPHSRHVQACR